MMLGDMLDYTRTSCVRKNGPAKNATSTYMMGEEGCSIMEQDTAV